MPLLKIVHKYRHFAVAILLAIPFLFPSCEKVEGPGGKATIIGKIMQIDIDIEANGDTTVEASYYIPDENVYLIYGNNTIYDDDVKTNFDGSYKFEYLRNGNYTLYAYTECDQATDICPVFKEVNIDKGDRVVNVDDIVIYNK